jgi:succinate dehydrogenase / fumarate reductase cytochrome b subunit
MWHNQKSKAVKDNRPVNIDFSTIELPITAYASILHRISGVAVFFGMAILLFLLDSSLESSDSFTHTQGHLDVLWVQGLVWLVLCGLIYHTMAGLKHLIMDFGIGETLEGGKRGAVIVLVGSVVLMILAGVWLVW